MKGFTDQPIAVLEDYGVPTRLINKLERSGMIYVRHLQGKTDQDILALPHVSTIQLRQLRKGLKDLYIKALTRPTPVAHR